MNIYPTPSGGGIPVGVHFTPTCNLRRGDQTIVGPGAAVCFDREGYNFTDISIGHLWRLATNLSLWKFAFSNFDLAVTEMCVRSTAGAPKSCLHSNSPWFCSISVTAISTKRLLWIKHEN